MSSCARVLIIAGSDSGGGAGIQGDIKTVTCLGGYAATAITALTAQNTLGVHSIYSIPPDFIAKQIRVVLDDIGADSIKTGMLHNADVISTIADVISDYDIPLILDPVMVAKGGAPLLEAGAISTLKHRLFPQATLITPNIPEAELLTGKSITNQDDIHQAAREILAMGPKAVLIKGGHMDSDTLVDLLVSHHGNSSTYTTARIDTTHTHGTGCSFASAIATLYAQGHSLDEAVEKAHEFIQHAITYAPGLGKGHGPLGFHKF